jgi:hypothetical protein
VSPAAQYKLTFYPNSGSAAVVGGLTGITTDPTGNNLTVAGNAVIGGNLTVGSSGSPTNLSIVEQTGTSVSVPLDASIFVGNDNVFRCQLSTAKGGGQCITKDSLPNNTALYSGQIPPINLTSMGTNGGIASDLPLNYVGDMSASGSSNMGANQFVFNPGNYGSSPIAGALSVIAESNAVATDTTVDLLLNTYNSLSTHHSYHHPFEVKVDDYDQLRVCNISASHVGLVTVGNKAAGDICASVSQNPYSKLNVWANSANHNVATLFQVSAVMSNSILNTVTATPASRYATSAFYLWNSCIGATNTDGTCGSGNVPAQLQGNGTLLLNASTFSPNVAPLNLAPGTAPGAPNNGDLWTTSAGLYVRINGGTVGPLGVGGGGAFSAITSGTNTTASMVVGSGASLAPSAYNAGTLSANGLVFNGGTLGTGAVPTTGQFLQYNGTSIIGNGDVLTYHTPATGIARTTSGSQAVASSELSGDATTSGSNAVTVSKINGTAFSGTNNNLVCFGASNTPADCSIAKGNVVAVAETDGNIIYGASGAWTKGTALPNGITATTQSANDNSTKVATTAYVDSGLSGKAASNASATVNGQTCTLGSTCNVETATAGQMAVSGGSGAALTGWADFTISSHTGTLGASGILDLSAASVTAGLKIPSAAGAIPTADGFIATNTTTHAHVWGSNGTTLVGAVAATGTNTATTCTNQVITAVSGTAIPTCNSVSNAMLSNSSITIAGTSVALGGSTSSLPSPGAIGGTTPSTGAFTTLTGTSSITLGTNGGTGGSVVLNGSTSGSATISTSSTGVLALPSGATATNMALTTPTLGVASATTVNKVTITAPATGSTLTVADGKTLTATNTMDVAKTAGTSGGIPYYDTTTSQSSSGALTINVLVKGGGAGAGPTNSSITDNGTTISTSEPIATTSNIATGSTPPTFTVGTSGAWGVGEGTSPSSLTTASDYLYANSTNHCFDWIYGNNSSGTDNGCLAALALAQTFTAAQTFSSTIGVAGPVQSNAANTALIITGGISAATTGASGTLTAGGENVNGGSTASMAGGAATFQGGDNASSGATETAGAVTLRGGDTTNASAAVQTTGAVTIRGGNNTATGAGPTLGAVTITGGTQSGAATNVAGADVTISGGLGTGNATPAHVKLRAPSFSNASGSTAQAQATTYVVHKKSGSTTSGTATNMFNIPIAANQTIGVEVIVHVETTQGTPQNCSTTEVFIASAQNTSSTVTQQTTSGTIGTICSTGTLTLAAAFSTANPAVFSVTPSWTTIVPTGVIITVEINNLSQQDVTLL